MLTSILDCGWRQLVDSEDLFRFNVWLAKIQSTQSQSHSQGHSSIFLMNPNVEIVDLFSKFEED